MQVVHAKKVRPKAPYVVDERDYDAEFKVTRDKLFARFQGRAEHVYEGRNRRAYLIKGYVVKVPLNWDGIADNSWEGSVRNGDQPLREYDIVYPKTRIVDFEGIPVLMMERVHPATSRLIKRVLGRVPKWIDRVDCCQVGFTKDRRLVAYDYGPR
jgi:hypothetical protein